VSEKKPVDIEITGF